MSNSNISRLSSSWAAFRHPTTTQVTAGCPSGNCDVALCAQAIERSVGGVDGFVVVVVGVMDVQDVDAVEAQPSQAFLEGPHDAVVTEVEHGVDGRRAAPGLAGFGQRVRTKKPADLAGEVEFVAGLLPEHLSPSHLGQPMSVERRGVEEADGRVPGTLDDGHA